MMNGTPLLLNSKVSPLRTGMIGATPHVPEFIGPLDGNITRGGAGGGILVLSLLPRFRALDQRPFILNVLDLSIVARVLRGFEVLLRQGVVVFVRRPETRGDRFLFMREVWRFALSMVVLVVFC